MRKLALLLCLLALVVVGAANAATGGVTTSTYTFTPSASDLGDLDHGYYYGWLVNWSVPAGETITSAVLTISDINDWQRENNDALYIHLLDTVSTKDGKRIGGAGGNVWQWDDSPKHSDDGNASDDWSGQGSVIGTYTDPDGGTGYGSRAETLTYNFGSLGLLDELASYSSDGSFGFGFDPDCHYSNSGVSFVVTTTKNTTTATPEPGTLATLAFGAIPVLAGFRSRLRRK